MIAVSSKGTSFRALATYLAHGRNGQEQDRVAWTASRNIPTDNPELAAHIMRATAEQSQRVRKPVYHLAISFDPTDKVDRAMMERIADRVLKKLELQEHQAVIVAHKDQEHPHMHLLVNRVHPTKGVAWDLSHDFKLIQEELRIIEPEFGLREVPGRLALVPDRVTPDRSELTPGEFRQKERGEELFIERVRNHAPKFRQATSWQQLEASLSEHGLRVERKGQGLVVTDGINTIKASRIARDLSLKGLERRYGVSYEDRNNPKIETVQEMAKRDASRYVYVKELTAYSYDTEFSKQDIKAKLDNAQVTVRRNRETKVRVDSLLAKVYRDPIAANAEFARLRKRDGLGAAVKALRESPESFGALQTVVQKKWGGLRTIPDDTQARRYADQAATAMKAWLESKQAHSRKVDNLTRDASWMERRATQAQEALKGLPSLARLEKSLTPQAIRLLPAELRHLRNLVMSPHKSFIPTGKDMVKAAVLGKEERER